MPTRHPAGSRRRPPRPPRHARHLGAQVKRAREALGLTMTEAGASVGRSMDQWSRYERGVSPVPVFVVQFLGRALADRKLRVAGLTARPNRADVTRPPRGGAR